MEKQKCPELRFKKYINNWIAEQVKDVISNRSAKYNPALEQSDFPCIELEHLSQVTGEILGTVSSLKQKSIKNKFDSNNILFGKLRPYLKKFANPNFAGVCSSEIWVLSSEKQTNDFLFQFVQSNQFLNLVNIQTGSKMPRADWKYLDSEVINYPEKSEQIQIAKLLKELDQSITLKERKFAQTQNIKKAFLEKIFPKIGAKQPKIRLKGFTGDWQIEAIGDVLEEVFRPISLDNETKYRLVTVKRRNGGIAERAILKGKDILVKSQFEVKAGEYIISKRQVVHGATGLVPPELDGSVVSNEYLVGQGTDKLNIEFFALLSTLPEMYKKFFLSSYGVDIEKLFFDVNDWKKREILLPSLEEQVQISAFFKQVDETLKLQKQQLQTLKNLKQAFLEKMFV
ncbi:restriction endonuclease subunit S [Acinetobacter terrae]|uniref:restriction endonuclease subunit S n=1 Tax=Acinetobacter terrae TaxID=2731247 RepID=UPI0007D8161F|nr:restriction endonuclease subunit S [Acinetobacter terrae]OAL76347.1 hypothetical protein AY608_08505 [Acinetobacter terrae]